MTRTVTHRCSSPDAPRLILAHGLDISDESVQTIPVAVTCESSMSFNVPDDSLEWTIETHELVGGQGHPACGDYDLSDPEILIEGATFPPTQTPADTAATETNPERRAQPTTLDQILSPEAETANDSTTSFPPIHLRYETFIEPTYVGTPSTTLGQVWIFGGDGRTVQQPGGTRVLIDSVVRFDGSAPTHSVNIGETSRWSCDFYRWPPAAGCSGPETATSDGSSVTVTGSSTATSANVNMSMAEPNPLLPAAPNLDADAQFTLRAGGSTVSVVHDGMPTHAIWMGPAESHYYLVYVSPSYALHCLGPLPGCTVEARVAF